MTPSFSPVFAPNGLFSVFFKCHESVVKIGCERVGKIPADEFLARP